MANGTKESVRQLLADPETPIEWLSALLICLYRRQSGDERTWGHSAHKNKRGFNKMDAAFLSEVAKRSESRECVLTPKEADCARKRLAKYAGQLADALNSGEVGLPSITRPVRESTSGRSKEASRMSPPEGCKKVLSELAARMDDILSQVTGLDGFARKQVVYYTLATHALESSATFPLLVLKGPMGTGKSRCQSVIAPFAIRPNNFSLRGRTLPTFRDELVKCHDGTAIIEEADQAWKDLEAFECLLSDRYQRPTAQTSRKESDGTGGWNTLTSFCFGATVLHRRLPFIDTALNGRSVFVRFRAVHDRSYTPLDEIADDLEYGKELARDLSFSLPDVPPIIGVAARVFDTYKPLLAVAQICEDTRFRTRMEEHLKLETLQLKEAQSLEPDGIVLRAFIERLTKRQGSLDFSRNITVSAVRQAVWDNERVELKSQQVAALLRDLGFETKNSHGVTVVVPKRVNLVRACEECGYEDDSISALRKEVLSGRDG
jgi:hypothetical protein